MTMTQLIFIGTLLGGILSFVVALFLTRQTWRPDVEPFGRRSSILQIALHPERFANPERLGEIRFLNRIGAALLCGAAVALAYEVVSFVL